MTGGETQRALAAIAHDVGKHVARTAVNLRGGEVPEVLAAMLAKDLYALRDGRRASSVLAAMITAAGEAVASNARVARSVSLLAEVDALEAGVVARERAAIARAAAIACEVRDLLRAAALEGGVRGAGAGGPRTTTEDEQDSPEASAADDAEEPR